MISPDSGSPDSDPRTPAPWPPALAGAPAISVIDRAIARHRLGRSLLLHGDRLDTLAEVADGIADRLLNEASPASFSPEKHPDFFALRPTGKMRQITAPATRELIRKVQLTAALSAHKVAVVYEADRMNLTAANIFLKTLEEPPANTTLLLLTVHPYALLPTLRSRCLHFRFPADPAAEIPSQHEGWSAWRDDYRAWLDRIPDLTSDKAAVADHIFSIYGLLARFGFILEKATAAAWAGQKDSLPPDLDEEEQTAIETGIANGLRARLFAEIEEATGAYARPRLMRGDELARRAFPAAIGNLENGARLLRLNLNESAVLENFLLASLRLWSKY